MLESFKKYHVEESSLLYLLTEICGITRTELYTNLNMDINEEKLLKVLDAIDKYVNNNIPVQYLVGYTYFYGLKIYVNKNVLIPRFATEEVVHYVIDLARNMKSPNIIDVGTGSGCIAIALKKHLPDANVTAVDISNAALDVAKKNALINDVSINYIQNDLLSGINDKFDIIVSNPPYIDQNEYVMDLVKNNEPHLALFSPENGLYHYRMILDQSRNLLSSNGIIIFEIAYNKKQEMLALSKKYYHNIDVIKDINKNDRIMIIR